MGLGARTSAAVVPFPGFEAGNMLKGKQTRFGESDGTRIKDYTTRPTGAVRRMCMYVFLRVIAVGPNAP